MPSMLRLAQTIQRMENDYYLYHLLKFKYTDGFKGYPQKILKGEGYTIMLVGILRYSVLICAHNKEIIRLTVADDPLMLTFFWEVIKIKDRLVLRKVIENKLVETDFMEGSGRAHSPSFTDQLESVELHTNDIKLKICILTDTTIRLRSINGKLYVRYCLIDTAWDASVQCLGLCEGEVNHKMRLKAGHFVLVKNGKLSVHHINGMSTQ